MPQNVKNPSLALKQQKQRNNDSMHAKPPEFYEAYDTFINIDDIDNYYNTNDKVAFIELNLRQIKGFIGMKIDTKNRRIIVKNRSYHGMMYTVRLFNAKFKNTYMKLRPAKYFLMDGYKVSSKEFKIMNIPKEITKDQIQKAIFSIIKECSFYIKNSGIKTRNQDKQTNTIFFTVNNEHSRNILKGTWSLMLDKTLYIIAPATATVKDLLARKYYRGEFFGFHPEHNMDKIMEVLTPHQPMHAFRQTEEKIIVEFKSLGIFIMLVIILSIFLPS
jgi:hypothetical protein